MMKDYKNMTQEELEKELAEIVKKNYEKGVILLDRNYDVKLAKSVKVVQDIEDIDSIISIMRVDADTLIKLIDNYLKTMDVNEELYNKLCELSDKEIKTHESVIEFMEKYEAVSNFVPQCKWAFDLLFYDTLHIDKFLNEI